MYMQYIYSIYQVYISILYFVYIHLPVWQAYLRERHKKTSHLFMTVAEVYTALGSTIEALRAFIHEYEDPAALVSPPVQWHCWCATSGFNM